MAARDSRTYERLNRGGVRTTLAVLATFALLLLPLRAACPLGLSNPAHAAGLHQHLPAAHQVGHGESQLKPCCANLYDGALVHSAVPDLSGGTGAVLFTALLLSGLVLPVSRGNPLRLAGASPPFRSFYARSARILR